MKHPKWKLHKSVDHHFYFTLVAPNGEVILTSEMYASKQMALKGIKSVQSNANAQILDLAK